MIDAVDVKRLQSREVVEQRVGDLVDYLKSSLPSLFGEETSVSMSRQDLILVLTELTSEFDEDIPHFVSSMEYMGTRIENIMDAVVNAAGESKRAELRADGDDFENYQAVVFEVVWSSILPSFSGDVEVLREVVLLGLIPVMNGYLWENPNWENYGYDHVGLMKNLFDDLYMGMYGFLALILYIHITTQKIYPDINIHLVPYPEGMLDDDDDDE